MCSALTSFLSIGEKIWYTIYVLIFMDPLTISPRDTSNKKTPQRQLRDTEDFSEEQEQRGGEVQKNSFIGEVFKFAVLAILIVVPFRLLVAQPFIVSGASMSPTFETGEYLIVDQITYHLEEPKRGDVVIFKYPNDPSKYFIKRIIGLPGEVVQLANGNTVIINPNTQNEITLNEQYLIRDKTDDHLSITLSSDEYFVMGDNRNASSDSRVWGPVPRDKIIGRALLRLLPIHTFSFFPGAYDFSSNVDVKNISSDN